MVLRSNTPTEGKLIGFVYEEYRHDLCDTDDLKIEAHVPDQLTLAPRAAYRPSRNGAQMPWLWRVLLPICVAVLVVNLAIYTTQAASTSPRGESPSGYVEMTQVQAAYIR
jgi:hypothetical protein